MEPEQLAQIKIGQTTQAEVESLLGKPDGSRRSHGQKVLIYQRAQDEQRHIGVNDLGFPGPVLLSETLAGKEHTTFDTTEIVIAKDGRVADIRRWSMERYYTGVFVHDDSPKADIAKANQIQLGVTTREQLVPLLGVPPSFTWSQDGNTRQLDLWFCDTGQFKQVSVISGQNGVVDEVKSYFKEGQRFPKGVDAAKLVQIKEQQSTREVAESILGRPVTISRDSQGSFYTYYIKVNGAKEEVYIEYNEAGLITRLIRKQLPEFK